MERARQVHARRRCGWIAGLAMCACLDARALEARLGGRIMFGSVARLEQAEPDLLTSLNAPLVGLAGRASGANADDANLNFRRHARVSTALQGYLELSAREGRFNALVRLKAWRDVALEQRARPWGNSINGYSAGAALGDGGAARLSQFSGASLLDAYIEHGAQLGAATLTARLGQQSLAWGARTGIGGGLEALNARDLPALHRAGASSVETRVPVPMAFARLAFGERLAVEAFGARFAPTALDLCGTFYAVSDYLAQGCDAAMAGLPAQDDRARVRSGALLRRLPTPGVDARDAGVALVWQAFDTDFGLYHAHTTWRVPMPGLRRSSRAGPPIVPGDPGGANMAFFTEYPGNIELNAFTFARKRGRTSVFGELSYRPRAPFMLSPSDALPPFLNAGTPALLRDSASLVPPGGLFHGYDLHPVLQAQIGLQREAQWGAAQLAASAEAVSKHAIGLPDPALRRYGRADLFGTGPVFGVCTVSTATPALQCTQNGYASANAWGYRLRVDAKWAALAPHLAGSASATFSHDVKGWSGDFLLNEGRRTLNLTLRLEYRQRYLAEMSYQPVWGGDYNPLRDRDTLALAVGIKF